jgi:predicted dithiol-disulfide oxidoreductase (DUF899 family)
VRGERTNTPTDAEARAEQVSERSVMNLTPVVSAEEWQAAHDALLVKEKEATRARDALAAERRRRQGCGSTRSTSSQPSQPTSWLGPNEWWRRHDEYGAS